MLAFVRRSATKWVAGAILLLVLVAIVITGFGTGGVGGLGSLTKGATGGDGSETLATVDGRAVTASEVHDLVTREFSRARQQTPTLDMQTFLAQGAFEQVVAQAIGGRAIQAFASDQGIAASQMMIDREIANIPAFRNLTGQFDQSVYMQQLRALNLTEAKLRDDVAQSLTQRQLLGPIALGGRVPEGVAREYANLLLERRTGMIAVVPTAQLAGGLNPTDAEVAAFYRTNRAAFTTPERRVVKYAVIDAVQAGAVAPATEAEIAAVYRNSPRSYGARETRTLQSIVFPTQDAAESFARSVRGGTAFISAAVAAGFTVADVTFADQNRDQFARITNAPVAAAAFAAAQGAVVGPTRSELGFHVVRVDHVTTTAARPIESVRAEIAAAIDQRKRGEALAALIAAAQEQLSSGASFEEIARGHHLTIVTTPPITAAGQPAAGEAWTAPAELTPLLRAAFDVDPDDPQPSIEQITPNERFALLGLDRVVPAAPPPLAQIVAQVRAAFVEQRARQAARVLADHIAQRINSGTPAAQAFAEAQPRIANGRRVDLRRLDISHSGQQVPPPLVALFSIPEHHARVMPAENNAGWFVVVHESRVAGDASTNAPLIQQTQAEFARSLNEEIAQQAARAIELRQTITRDDDAIRRARATLGGGATPAAR